MNIEKHKADIHSIHKDIVYTGKQIADILSRVRILINDTHGQGFTDEYIESLEAGEIELIEIKHKLSQTAKIIS